MQILATCIGDIPPKSARSFLSAKPSVSKTLRKDAVHFSGDNRRTSNTENTSSQVVARKGQSRLFTAANDVHPDAFLKELENATKNPNEYVDTSILQVHIDNHASSIDRKFEAQATNTHKMLTAFLKDSKMELLEQDKQVLPRITTTVLNLNDHDLLDALTRCTGYDMKKLDDGLQNRIWQALDIGEPISTFHRS
jgi:hypothetical protein